MDRMEMTSAELWVVLCSDTEDNHPNYVPGWTKRGSDYDRNPAIIRWDWTQFWHDLSEYFNGMEIPITWLIRVDDGPIYDHMLRQFRNDILKLRSKGDEIGIHVHTFVWDSAYSKWKQTRDPVCEARIVRQSLEYFREVLGFFPLSIRMGWNAMSNEIMEILDTWNVMVDASAIPGNHCDGKYDNRDNFYDWLNAPQDPYHPCVQDYRSEGKRRIIEMPVATLQPVGVHSFSSVANWLSNLRGSSLTTRFLPHLSRWFDIAPNPFFYISPWWSVSAIDAIMNSYVKKARRDGTAFLVGFFHSSDILDPHTGRENTFFKRNVNRVCHRILKAKGIDVKFLTLLQAANKHTETYCLE